MANGLVHFMHPTNPALTDILVWMHHYRYFDNGRFPLEQEGWVMTQPTTLALTQIPWFASAG